MIKRITEYHVEHIAFRIARENMTTYEPIPDFSTRSPELLNSSLNSPFQIFDGKQVYPGFVLKASMLLYFLIKNHPFQNGNKRIGMMSLLTFLFLNGRWMDMSNNMFYTMAVEIAKSKTKDKDKIVLFTSGSIKSFMVKK